MVTFALGESVVAVLAAIDRACHLAPGADLGALVASAARALRGGLDLAYVGIAVHVERAGAVTVRGEDRDRHGGFAEVLPLVAGGHVIGVLSVEATADLTARGPLLALIASRLAVTLDHARLLREQQVANARLAATARELALLNEIAVAATADLELRPMLGRIVDAMHARFGWEFVACIRIDRPRQRFVCEAVATALPTAIHVGYSRPFGSGVVGEVAATGRPILIDDVATWPNYVETLPGARSELCVPAIYRGEVVALLNLESPRPAAFRDQVALVTTVAEQVAGAIASARLLDEVRAQAGELAILSEVSRVATSSVHIDEVLTRVTAHLQERLRLPLVSLHRLAGDALELVAASHTAAALDAPLGARTPLATGLIGQAARTRVAVRCDDVAREPAYHRIRAATQAELAVPIAFGDELLGVLNLEADHPAELAALEGFAVTVADQIAGAVRLAQLNRHLADRNRVLGDLFSRYVAPDLVGVLLTDPERFRTRGERREVSVLFADIRGFTGLAQRLDSEQVLALLNEFYAAMGEAIFGHRGSINRILGDGLMAVFGVPERLDGHAAAAVAAALAMQAKVEALSPSWQARTGAPLEIAMAINCGDVTVGSIGDPRHLAFTVLGDVVNVAARLETEAKARGVRLLVTDRVRAACPDVAGEALGAIALRGRSGEVGIHRLA
ncbi:MAG: GAF domain-containing protein [Myxococcales bacterium]|nr:GAF domain-containing protein [Myxococcales bacterium]